MKTARVLLYFLLAIRVTCASLSTSVNIYGEKGNEAMVVNKRAFPDYDMVEYAMQLTTTRAGRYTLWGAFGYCFQYPAIQVIQAVSECQKLFDEKKIPWEDCGEAVIRAIFGVVAYAFIGAAITAATVDNHRRDEVNGIEYARYITLMSLILWLLTLYLAMIATDYLITPEFRVTQVFKS